MHLVAHNEHVSYELLLTWEKTCESKNKNTKKQNCNVFHSFLMQTYTRLDRRMGKDGDPQSVWGCIRFKDVIHLVRSGFDCRCRPSEARRRRELSAAALLQVSDFTASGGAFLPWAGSSLKALRLNFTPSSHSVIHIPEVNTHSHTPTHMVYYKTQATHCRPSHSFFLNGASPCACVCLCLCVSVHHWKSPLDILKTISNLRAAIKIFNSFFIRIL